MKTKQHKLSVIIIIFCIIACISIIIIYKKNSVTIDVKEITKTEDSVCIKQVKNKSIFDVAYKIKETDNDKYCEQEITFKNNTKKQKVYMVFNIHIPQKLIDENIVSQFYDYETYGSIYNLDTVPRVTEATIHNRYEITESDLTEQQQETLKKLKNILYCEAYMDKYIFYLKLSPKGYEIISLEEFEKNAGPFSKGKLIKNLKNTSPDYKIVRIKKID
ncbi:hypothetical protein [Hathewaya massiliensis]|uniref:hypothetical protein n=1 Tax=Hathewaya massiliensis TaxID=1964382 RepID=UPI001157BB73|nr:hypothetical protein [Hathewaya massiliensis]